MPRQGEGVSEWALRERAAALGWPVSHTQFQSYREAGLIGNPVRARWPGSLAERLVTIRQAEQRARPLFRRVVLLRGDGRDFLVPAPKLRAAMVALAPTVSAPLRKLRRVDVALQQFVAYLREGRALSEREVRRWRDRPRASDWVRLLEAEWMNDQSFERLAKLQYQVAHGFEAGPEAVGRALARIPFEEQVLALVVRQLWLLGSRAPEASMKHPA